MTTLNTSVLYSFWPSHGDLDRACLTEARLRLDRVPATSPEGFLPLRTGSHSSRNKKAIYHRPLSLIAALRVRSDRLRSCRLPSRPRWARLATEKRNFHGYHRHITAIDNGFTGTIKTLTIDVEARFEPIRKPTDKGPQYRVLCGATEIGAAWKKHSEQTGRDYLSVKFDDPSLVAPLYATLVDAGSKDGFHLTWFRYSRDYD